MSGDREYNGWTNYETWLVALWIDNDPGTYATRCEMAQDAWRQDSGDKVRIFADMLENWVTDDMCATPESGLLTDLVGAALSEVNWYEIAESSMDEVGEPEADEDEA